MTGEWNPDEQSTFKAFERAIYEKTLVWAVNSDRNIERVVGLSIHQNHVTIEEFAH